MSDGNEGVNDDQHLDDKSLNLVEKKKRKQRSGKKRGFI
jgi:hypothetical protein